MCLSFKAQRHPGSLNTRDTLDAEPVTLCSSSAPRSARRTCPVAPTIARSSPSPSVTSAPAAGRRAASPSESSTAATIGGAVIGQLASWHGSLRSAPLNQQLLPSPASLAHL